MPYHLPEFLQNVLTASQYEDWLHTKAKKLLDSDFRRGILHARDLGEARYRDMLHEAVRRSQGVDRYTGEQLDWTVTIGPANRRKPGRQVVSMPQLAVDHIVPGQPQEGFDILTPVTNAMKSNLEANEFVRICRLVAARHPMQ